MLDTRAASSLSDNELLARLIQLRRCERETTLAILRFLNEVELRKLHLKLGYSSLFMYCTEHLHYSESAAGRRVQAARCVRQFPQAAALLESDAINLTTLGLVASILTERNASALLNRIRGKKQREVEAIASTFRPPIVLRDRVQPVNVVAPTNPVSTLVPQPAATESGQPENEVTNSRSGSEKAPGANKIVQKLYIQFLADEAFMKKYNEACALLSNKLGRPSFEAVFTELLDEFIKRHSPKEKQARRQERRTLTPGRKKSSSERGGRVIAAKTRDAVFVRDRGQCTFKGHNGRCGEKHNLHIDHMTPVAHGGTADPNNLRLLCSRHNQLEANRLLGEDVMNRHRLRPD